MLPPRAAQESASLMRGFHFNKGFLLLFGAKTGQQSSRLAASLRKFPVVDPYRTLSDGKQLDRSYKLDILHFLQSKKAKMEQELVSFSFL